MSTANPDTRPLPPGWISQWDGNHDAWFYVNTACENPTAVWTHPLDSSCSSPSPSLHLNPDTRQLPPGWLCKYDDNYKTWYYVDTNQEYPQSTWVHPFGPPTSPPPTQGTQLPNHPPPGPPVSPPPQERNLATSRVQPSNRNPDPRPLPPKWYALYDPNYRHWYYWFYNPPLDSRTFWEHPLDQNLPQKINKTLGVPTGVGTLSRSQLPVTPPPGLPAGSPPGKAAVTISRFQPSDRNPDPRPLPPKWYTIYDPNYRHWYYWFFDPPLDSRTSWDHPLDQKLPQRNSKAQGQAIISSYSPQIPSPGPPAGSPPASYQYGPPSNPPGQPGYYGSGQYVAPLPPPGHYGGPPSGQWGVQQPYTTPHSSQYHGSSNHSSGGGLTSQLGALAGKYGGRHGAKLGGMISSLKKH